MKMFIFPHAGGSILNYAFLNSLKGITLYFMRLNFDRENKITDYSQLIQQFQIEIDSLWNDNESAIFLGISLGGQIAYDLVKIYEKQSNRLISHLIIVNSLFEINKNRFVAIANGNIKRLMSFLISIGSSLSILNDSHAVNNLFLDVKLFITRPKPRIEKINTSLLFICGQQDKEVCRHKDKWNQVSNKITVSTYHGGHLFFLKNPYLLCDEILCLIQKHENRSNVYDYS